MELTDLIAPAFYDAFWDVTDHKHTHYWFAGGRGSTKSTFVSVMIPLGMMQHKNRNAVIYRRYGNYLRDSVYAQIIWALDKLGVSHLWKATLSPLQLVYLPTGQKILFRGMDDPIKSKSIKADTGYFAYVWYEEASEFNDMESLETVNASLLRGGDKFWVFYSYNPPKSKRSWVNNEASKPRPDKLLHKSTYETVPEDWLGEPFLIEAEHTKEINFDKWRWMYGGEAIGTGGEVFSNVTLREISKEEILSFDEGVRRGIDWGYGIDPFVYIVGNYDSKYRKLTLFYEKYALNVSNRQAAEWIKEENLYNGIVYCDNAEPKSIAFLQGEGISAIACKKYAGSVQEGYSFMSDSIEEIIIDPRRCPNAAREFIGYELEMDMYGNFKSKYPDRNNHCLIGSTLVETTDGIRRIDELVGTSGQLYCYDENKKQVAVGNYTDCRRTQCDVEVFELELEDGITVTATADHPVYTQRGWVELGELTTEDKVLKIGGYQETVRADSVKFIGIKRITPKGRADVYNLEVEEHHNFAVNGGVIVHNCIDACHYMLQDDIAHHKFIPTTGRHNLY